MVLRLVRRERVAQGKHFEHFTVAENFFEKNFKKLTISEMDYLKICYKNFTRH